MPPGLRADLTEALKESIAPAAQVGTLTGFAGICIGGGVGVLRSAHPGMAAVYTGIQCFVLGSSFVYTRQLSLLLRGSQDVNERRLELQATTLAGVVSGAVAGRFWSRPTSLAGALIFGATGYFGQRAMHKNADNPPTEADRRSFLQRLADSKYSPIKSLSNEDYETMLVDKLNKVEAEIALTDEKLSELKQMQQISS